MIKLMGKNIITLSGPIIFPIKTSALVFKRNVTVIFGCVCLLLLFFYVVFHTALTYMHLLNLIQILITRTIFSGPVELL